MKRILIAPNAFKHSLSAIEAAQIIKSTLDSLKLDLKCGISPIADGGDGTIDILNFYFKKSKYTECDSHDALMRPVKSRWLLLDNETAVIELAKASGLALLKDEVLNPMWANTFGTGELILSALDKGCTKIILTLGGSATVDAGLGILMALGVKIFDKKRHSLKARGGILSSIGTIDLKSLDKRIKSCTLQLLCDVDIPLTGEKGTVQKFSTQKGAKEGEKVVLELGMRHFVQITKSFTKNDYSDLSMSGAAGGVAFGLKSFLGVELFNGFNYFSNLVSLEEKIKDADFIITGEGSLDSQTLDGKGVYGLARLAGKHNKKVIVFCGICDKNINWQNYNIDTVVEIKKDNITLLESLKKSKDLLEEAIKCNFKQFVSF